MLISTERVPLIAFYYKSQNNCEKYANSRQLMIRSTGFDTSCFTGCYVTGQTMGDSYFQKLHELRNDDAQESRRSGKVPQNEIPLPVKGENLGCESVHNDKRDGATNVQKGCEAI